MRLRFIWVGLIKEFAPEIPFTELAEIAKCKSHATSHEWHLGWRALPWTTRHAWLEFISGSDYKKTLMMYLAKDSAFRELEPPMSRDALREMEQK